VRKAGKQSLLKVIFGIGWILAVSRRGLRIGVNQFWDALAVKTRRK